ncbi:hypothetical protein Poly30_51080 [Planctomycetes bacterium Poly30]|uniref:DUF1552 domain-containing protein n=1 Tax=Saltatorellus ferox TaxID=2528018 RepID=A0A518EZN8_9BACT|nr:hypothetical protein Poly30_51080 [Planctomycetes bacterium Poly30]
MTRPHIDLGSLDRRRFLRGSAVALALPWFESVASALPSLGCGDSEGKTTRKRFASIYFPDGVPMPLREDPAFDEWSWFPHGSGRDFAFTKCLDVLTPLRDDLTIVSGMSHPTVRDVHGHSNADQFLTGGLTGGTGDYQNSISLDQAFAAEVGDQTRYSSLVMSTDGGTGTPRGAHTLSFDRNGRAIPAAHRPKKIFDSLFLTRNGEAASRLAISQSALDELLEDARSLRRTLPENDREALDEYLDAVRETEIKVEKAKRWMSIPLPTVDADHLNLEVTPDDPRNYLQTMFELMYLAFRTDSTRTATYQIGRENGIGHSDHLARAVGFPLSHQLSHDTKNPGGWKDFGTYCRFLAEEFGRFAEKLKATPEPGGQGNMLDHTLLLFGSASSAFHLSRNYPLVLAGGKRMGFAHGQYLNFAGEEMFGGAWDGGKEPWQQEFERDDRPLADLYLTMLRRLGVEAESFVGSRRPVSEV